LLVEATVRDKRWVKQTSVNRRTSPKQSEIRCVPQRSDTCCATNNNAREQNMLKTVSTAALGILLLSLGSIAQNRAADTDVKTKLAEWRQGVWISGVGTYTIWTDSHYFVVSYEGDTASPNLYIGASQVRLREVPGGDRQMFRETAFQSDGKEGPMVFDSAMFRADACNVVEGVIYDAVMEVTDEYILLATCNGDKEKIFSNGVSVYLPAGGGEFYSYRIEKLSGGVE
jgi:hypothetical protein